jgi:predicted metal-dependent HD superfamily phosphohydrolase
LIPAALLDHLRERYAEPQRHYHTWDHVEALLAHYRKWVRYFQRPGPVLWALYWHDAIYDPHASDNEEQSAQLLEKEAAGLLSPYDVTFAARLIRATATHTIPDGLTTADAEDLALFLDLDLSILGAPEDVYDRYEQAIRAEYAFVPEDAYRAGRSAILKGFLDRDRLYFTDIAHADWDAAARANLTRAIRALEQG